MAELIDEPYWNIRAGSLEVRLSENKAEIRAAQRLRYKVFYEEMAARPSPRMALAKRDFDAFDDIADHLLVIDHQVGSGAAGVVGTYRLMRRANIGPEGRFYTSAEYDIGALGVYPGEVLELGRSCVDVGYRTGQTMQLLWRGIAAYVFTHDVELMFGCASLPGVDPREMAQQLSYLHHYHLAPPALRARALPERYTAMDLVPAEEVDQRRARALLPPLIKGYLRLGGFVGDGAVVDEQFQTTDVCVVVKTDLVTEKYLRHYERNERERGLRLVYPAEGQ